MCVRIFLSSNLTWCWYESTITAAVEGSLCYRLYPGHGGGDARVDSGELLVGAVSSTIADNTNQGRPDNNIKLTNQQSTNQIKTRLMTDLPFSKVNRGPPESPVQESFLGDAAHRCWLLNTSYITKQN